MSGQFLRERLPDPETYYAGQGLVLKGSGPERKALCVFHADRNPSMSVNVQTGVFHCFACGAGGDVLKFHMERNGMGFIDAAKDLGAWDGVNGSSHSPEAAAARQKWEQERSEEAKRLEEERARARAEAAELAMTIIKRSDPVQPFHPYLVKKKIRPTDTMLEIHSGQIVHYLDYTPKADDEPLQGRLLVVPVKVGDAISTLELIDEHGRKSALWRGNKTGGYWATQKLPQGDGAHTILLGEGVATVTSAAVSTGHYGVAGLTHINLSRVAVMLRERYPSARIVLLADLGIGEKSAEAAAAEVGGYLAVPPRITDSAKDFNDIHQVKGLRAVKAAIEGAQPVAPKDQQESDNNMHSNLARIDRGNEITSTSAPEKSGWPGPLSDEAFHGLAGDIVKEISPHTEADEAAVLLQIIVSFGALVGRGPHVRVEGDQHHVNLFALIVGDTAKARKGTSWGRVKELFAAIKPANPADPQALAWPTVVEGLSSGEGLKWAVRDPIMRREKDAVAITEVEVDAGVSDKRILVVESEFAQVLRQCSRAGNTLSSTIRCAWDGSKLQTLTKNDPITATGAHISIIGHITADEMRAELTQTDSANGFANRFLFMCAKRSKSLPFGGQQMSPEVISHFANRLALAAAKARTIGAVDMSEDAKAKWAAVYTRLSEGHAGLFGAVTARAEAQCLRLALAYALMDEDDTIRGHHIMAALAIWARAEESARHVFGQSLGDPIADTIHRALKVKELTRTEISKLFNGHEKANRVDVALDLLKSRGMARFEKRLTTGAPQEVWSCL